MYYEDSKYMPYLKWLGFTDEEVNLADSAMAVYNHQSSGVIVGSFLRNFYIPVKENPAKLVYLVDILRHKNDVLASLDYLMNFNVPYCSDYLASDTYKCLRVLNKHYLTMNSKFNSMNTVFKSCKELITTNRNLPLSKITHIPELAEIGGIEDEVFSIYNSDRYEDASRYLRVKRRGDRVQLVPNRLPVVKYGESLKVDGVAELKEDEHSDFGNKGYTLYLQNKYVKLLNSFVICISLRMPQSHLGLFDIVCVSGTRLYVYATEWSAKNRRIKSSSTEYNSNAARIVDYGFTIRQLEDKLYKAAKAANDYYGGIAGMFNKMFYVDPETDFDQDKRISLVNIGNADYGVLDDDIDFSIG